jgi:RHS repeat-associated protein
MKTQHACRSVLDPVKLNNGDFDGDETWSQYDGDRTYSDYTGSGHDATVTAWYEPGIGMVEDASGTPVVKYYHDNLIGTTRFMTDASGTKIESAVYTAFGERVDGDARRFGYAGAYGYQTDAAAEMPFLHVGHRYYDPSIGRFLQRDPIGIAAGVNVYEYVGSQPITMVDPQGLAAAGFEVGLVGYKGSKALAGGATAWRSDAHRRHYLSCHASMNIRRPAAGRFVKGCGTCSKLRFAARRKAYRARCAKSYPKFRAPWNFGLNRWYE